MRKVSASVLMVMVSALVSVSALAEGHRVGVGVSVAAPSGDLDDGTGVYLSHMFDVSDMLVTYLGISYASGDYSLTADEAPYAGSYTETQLEAALIAQWPMDAVIPYAGIGGGYSYLSVDNMDVGNKFSMFYVFGMRMPIGERFGLEASARLSYLRPRSYNPQLETVDMDAWIYRFGATWEF